jgi:hypothetical protein
MSKEEIQNILSGIRDYNHTHPQESTTQRYIQNNFMVFKRSSESQQWNRDIILTFLSKAMMNGYQGIHFISIKYLASISLILEHYFGEDHYLSYRECHQHGKIVLHPNYEKLGVDPVKEIKHSFPGYADFCFD